MQIINIKQIIWLVVLFALGGLALAFNPLVRASSDIRSPELPPVCSSLQMPVGSKVVIHTYALGVQIYRWNGASWDFVEPLANLYANENYQGEFGKHYVGPTWELNNGNKVSARRLDGCLPDSTAIPWLLLQTVSSEGSGIFRKVTFIQRTNTAGGLAPTVSGSFVGEEKRVPYTAEYYFYRTANL